MRTRVHEYGGGAWTLAAPDLVVFSNFADQRLYRQRLGGEPVAITPEPRAAGRRCATPTCGSTPDGRTVFCVRELHGEGEAENQIVALLARRLRRADGARLRPRLLLLPAAQPRRRLARLDLLGPPEHAVGRDRALAGAAGGHRAAPGWSPAAPEESIFQPEWGADGRLHFVSDRDGWWNLYRGARTTAAEQLTAEQADLGHPQWLFGGATYAFLADGTIVCVRTERATNGSALLEPGAWEPRDLGLPYTSFGCPSLSARGDARSPSPPPARGARPRWSSSTSPAARPRSRARSSEVPIDPAYALRAAADRVPDRRRRDRARLLLPADQPDFAAPEGELPPLIVQSHGGPTSHATPALDREFAYWTSRGFGVVDVNYRGSSGYGRAYRDRLRGGWGVVDTEDCVAAARYLAESGEVDGERMAIRGGWAGGYATLCALDLPRRLRRRRQLLRGRRRRGARRATPTSSSRATSTA